MALDLSTNIVIISIFFSVLAVIAVAFRFRSRVLQNAKFGLDDWTIIPALVRDYGGSEAGGEQLDASIMGTDNPTCRYSQSQSVYSMLSVRV